MHKLKLYYEHNRIVRIYLYFHIMVYISNCRLLCLVSWTLSILILCLVQCVDLSAYIFCISCCTNHLPSFANNQLLNRHTLLSVYVTMISVCIAGNRMCNHAKVQLISHSYIPLRAVFKSMRILCLSSPAVLKSFPFMLCLNVCIRLALHCWCQCRSASRSADSKVGHSGLSYLQ